MESNKKINLKCEITGFDDATNDIIVTYRNEKLKIKLNNEFKTSFIIVKDIFNSNVNKSVSQNVPIALINVELNKNELTFNKELQSYFVLDPSILINVTDLTKFDYYERSIFNRKFSNFLPNKYTLIGNIVHEVFEDIITDISLDKSKYFDKLRKKLDETIHKNIIYFAILNLNIEKITQGIKNHLNALYLYIKKNKNFYFNKKVFSEHYIVDTDFGMKGKIDSVIMSKEKLIAVELKTGKTWKKHAKTGHSYQVQAYSLLLANKYKQKEVVPPLIIYSGDYKKYDFKSPQSIKLGLKVDLNYETISNVINLRNRLVADEIFYNFDYEHKRFSMCDKCFHLIECVCINNSKIKPNFELNPLLIDHYNSLNHNQKLFFNNYNKFLNVESLSVKRNFSNYFKISSEEKIKSGKRIEVIEIVKKYKNSIKVKCINNSEIRENDMCLVSDIYGPVKGNVAQGFIKKVRNDSIELNFSKPLTFLPKWIDTMRSDSIFDVNYVSLFNFFKDSNLSYLRNTISGNDNIEPNEEIMFDFQSSNFELNAIQKKAVMLSLGIKKLLLIQGPPGTGKTSIIAMIVRELNKIGKKIIISSFTHRALDEMIDKIYELDSDLKVFRITNSGFKLKSNPMNEETEKTNTERLEETKKIIDDFPILASTSYSWSSGKYDSLLGKDGYDVAIIDEASQMIMPNSFGVLRLAKSHILVGDHHQQPPILTSNDSRLLNKTLFQELFDNQNVPDSVKVMLNTQHRMNPVLGNFISKQFYDGKLLNNTKISFKKLYDEKQTPSTISKICYPKDVITIVDTQNSNDNLDSKSFEEDGEIILDLFEFLIRKGVNPKTIGIIAPYRAQVALIRRKLDLSIENKSLKIDSRDLVDTVDRFQGDERDVIIFSTCVSDKNNSSFLGDKRKINVALSRAKKKLIIVGDWNAAVKYDVFKSLDKYVKDSNESKLIRI